jgi:endonuclease/exonuclease/phosphatase family metal-dependent hydrolase
MKKGALGLGRRARPALRLVARPGAWYEIAMGTDPRRASATLALLLAAGLGASCASREARPVTGSAPAVRVVSYNIRHGEGMDGRVDLERTARVLESLRPDLVALQEVDRVCTRSGGVDQAAFLGRRLGMHHAFAAFMDYQGGEYGLAVLSRYPVEEALRHVLPPGAEPRSALELQVRPPGTSASLSFLSVHFDWTREDLREAQVAALVEALAARRHPVVVAGDYNARADSPTLARLAAAGWDVLDKGGAPTFPADSPRVEIDFVAVRGIPAAGCTSTVYDERVASDHRPVVARLPLP